MDVQLAVICLLTMAINFIGTLAYAARIAGVRTRRIALSFALFNILVLGSRLSNSFLAPFLAKRIENGLHHGGGEALLSDFRIILASASVSVLLGILFVPTGQRMFSTAIGYFQHHRSTARLILRSLSPGGIRAALHTLRLPRARHFADLRGSRAVGWGVLAANLLTQALLTVGVLASLYAGYLDPDYRVTSSQLSAVINGVATILLFAFIDPQLSVMTDDVIDGRVSEAAFRRTVVWISISRLAGTVLAQTLFLPAAALIAFVARAM